MKPHNDAPRKKFTGWKNPLVPKRGPGAEDGLELELGWMIQVMRESRRWTQADLARAMGTTQSAISRLEGGWSTPSLSLIKRLAKTFGVEARVQFFQFRSDDMGFSALFEFG